MSRASIFLALLLIFSSRTWGGNCTGSSCTACKQDESGSSYCTTVSYSASCECTLRVGERNCTLSGVCSYSPGGGGSGGGTGGGGGTTCTRVAGSWCPAECTSCDTVFWY